MAWSNTFQVEKKKAIGPILPSLDRQYIGVLEIVMVKLPAMQRPEQRRQRAQKTSAAAKAVLTFELRQILAPIGIRRFPPLDFFGEKKTFGHHAPAAAFNDRHRLRRR